MAHSIQEWGKTHVLTRAEVGIELGSGRAMDKGVPHSGAKSLDPKNGISFTGDSIAKIAAQLLGDLFPYLLTRWWCSEIFKISSVYHQKIQSIVNIYHQNIQIDLNIVNTPSKYPKDRQFMTKNDQTVRHIDEFVTVLWRCIDNIVGILVMHWRYLGYVDGVLTILGSVWIFWWYVDVIWTMHWRYCDDIAGS